MRLRRACRLLAWPILLVSLGLCTRVVAGRAWNAFVGYETPFAFAGTGEACPPLAETVVVLLVDGLGEDASRRMSFLEELRRRGADVSCRAGVPSLSLPGRAVIASGAWQEVNGRTTNFHPRPLSMDHLFRGARRAGRHTALCAGRNVHTLFSPYVDEAVVYPRDEPRLAPDFARFESTLQTQAEGARALLASSHPALLWVDLTIMDECGHAWGARSEEYGRAARLVDEEIRKTAGALDLARSALVVTADHGHVPAGGHGGDEEEALRVPLVLAGAGIRTGARMQAGQIDVGPTVAALVGAPLPASAQGRALVEVLDLTPAQRAALLARTVEQRRAFVEQYESWVRGSPTGVRLVSAAATHGSPEETLAGLEAQAAAARAFRLDKERRGRAVIVLGLSALLAVILMAVRAAGAVRREEMASAARWALLALALYVAGFRALGLGYSISLVNDDADLGPFLQKDMALALGSAAVAVGASAWWAARRGRRRAADRIRFGLLVAFLFASVFLAKAAVVYWRQGVFLRWAMPDFHWAFSFYMDALALMAIGLGAPLLVLAAWAGGKLAERRVNAP